MAVNNTNTIGYQTSSAVETLPEVTQSCQELPKPTQTYSPSEKHLVEWCEGSGVSEAIARLAVKPLKDRKIIAHRIGWKVYPDEYSLGWFASGLDLATMKPQAFGQFKPDIAIQFPEREKPTKYISDKGHPYDAIALPHPDKDFWQRVLDDASIIVDLDEGAKKSGAGMTCGFPSLALCGVSMWQRKGELVPNLAAVAVPGRTIRIRFDMDVLTKKEVRLEVKKLVKALEKCGCNILIAMWDKELGLKIDDVLAKHGSEMVHKIMNEAQPYPQWLKNLNAQMDSLTADSGEKKSNPKPPTPRATAAQLAEQYGDRWKYDDEQKTWRLWTHKHWEKVNIGAFKSLVKTTIDAKGIDYSGIEYINNIVELLQCDLRQIRWQMWDRRRYTNFSNCVLDGDKLTTSRHSPGMGFTSFLPFDYKPLEGDLSDTLEALRVNCPNIHRFFRTAMKDNERKMLKLLAIVNAVLKYRFFDLQMFVHSVGAPGSGKGTFARLLEKVVGRENFKGCQLDRLSDGSTKASVVDKQLVVFADERKPVGIDSILSFTGGDAVSYRELHTPAADAFFYGCFLICSNKPIFVGDTTGLERRVCLVHFDNPIPTEKRNHALESEFEAEVSALIGIALSLADSTVTQAIRGIGAERIAEFKAKEWEMKVETSSTAAFFDMNLVLDPTATMRTGKLYDAYKSFCETSGFSKVSIVKFPKLLADLLTDESLPFTRYQGAQAYFEGLRLRIEADNHPTHSQVLSGFEGVEGGIAGSLQGVVEGVVPLPDIGLRELRELDPKVLSRNENEKKCLPDKKESARETDLPPQTASTSLNIESVRDITPSLTPSEPPVKLPKVPKGPRILEVGDRVKVTADYPGSETFIGAEATVRQDRGKGDFDIEFDVEIPVGGRTRKSLGIAAIFLTVIPSAASGEATKSKKPFKVGDKVWVSRSDCDYYLGATGEIVEIGSTPVAGQQKVTVKFDKPVRGSIHQETFLDSQLTRTDRKI